MAALLSSGVWLANPSSTMITGRGTTTVHCRLSTREEKIANKGAPRHSILDSPSKIREHSDLAVVKRELDMLHNKIGELFVPSLFSLGYGD